MLHFFLLSVIGFAGLQIATGIHFPGLDVLKPFSTPDQQTEAVKKLIDRLLGPGYADQFTLTVDSTLSTESDVVIIDRGPQESIKVVGPSGVAVAWGVHHFLRNSSMVHISWDGKQLNVPKTLHHPAVRSTHHSIGRFRYFSNVCTFSYSYLWWTWTEWEQHLDWLALNGVNLPLAHVAQEAIWQKVYLKMGLTQQEIDAYFSGPAFLAWKRMGNLKHWGGPLSQDWHRTQLDLQKKILARMVEFGMVPVLPAFSGHVPDAVQRLYPNASITSLNWLSFNCSYTCVKFVDPTDALFKTIGTMFINEMKMEFGLYHAYSADPFNEMSSKSYAKAYLDAVGKGIYYSMADVDPDAVWVMQAWMFVGGAEWYQNDSAKNLLTAVPPGKLLLLDLYSEQIPVFQSFASFYGQPFIWNVLHNFGGVSGLFGAVSKINQKLLDAIQYPNSTLVGVGLTMEGIYQNYPIYQFSLDRFWSYRGQKINHTNWIRHYATQRYGQFDEILQNAWHLLWTSVYDVPERPEATLRYRNGFFNKDYFRMAIMTTRPSLSMDTETPYDKAALCKAWKYFISRSDAFTNSTLFRHDLVDVTREILQMLSASYYRLMIQAYNKKDAQSLSLYGGRLLQAYDDLERILATHEHFMLGKWIQQARNKGSNDADKQLFEYNMRNQVTLWGPNGEILDYARKDWAGLVADYYRPRWLLFISMLMESLQTGGPQFSQDRYNKVVFQLVEQPFTFKRSTFPDQPIGDSVQVAKNVFNSYYGECQSA